MDIIVYGVINSFILVLIAFGFTLVYGISRLPNFAHGAIYIFTGYISWILINRLNLGFFISSLVALISSALLGMFIYLFILKRIRGMTMNEIIATYAIGVAIIEFFRWLGFKGSTFAIPEMINGTIFIGDTPVDLQRVLIAALGVIIILMVYLFTKFTKTGLAFRGIAQDERAALMLGINSDLIGVLSMGLGSALCGFAALMILPLGNVVVEAGYNALIYALAVCIIGGIGSWAGTILASFVVGFLQILTVMYLDPKYQMVFTLLLIIITLIVKPSGFFGKQKELEERV
jgi:branched-chain amino acid transport system permease protein